MLLPLAIEETKQVPVETELSLSRPSLIPRIKAATIATTDGSHQNSPKTTLMPKSRNSVSA